MEKIVCGKMNQTKTPDQLYFTMQAEIGITKHMGGKQATKKLIELCNIKENSFVLDVGCGTGKTACFLAEKIGCKVFGIDLYEGMIKQAKERAKRKKIKGIEFSAANAEQLPFKDNTFDAVISESVVAFFKDKQKGLNEFARVTKPNGFIGINELTWTGNPEQKITDSMKNLMGAEFNDFKGWKKLMENSGLKEIQVTEFKPNALKQFFDEISWMELRDFFLPWIKVVLLIIKSKEYRNYIKGMAKTPLNVSKYMGYGIYSGRK